MEDFKIKTFTDLYAWQRGHELVLKIYNTTEKFPKSEMFSLTDQMKRAAISITSNIAEGFGRCGYKEKLHFYFISQGSLTELKSQLFIARDIGYITKDKFLSVYEMADKAHQLLQGLITKTKSFSVTPKS